MSRRMKKARSPRPGRMRTVAGLFPIYATRSSQALASAPDGESIGAEGKRFTAGGVGRGRGILRASAPALPLRSQSRNDSAQSGQSATGRGRCDRSGPSTSRIEPRAVSTAPHRAQQVMAGLSSGASLALALEGARHAPVFRHRAGASRGSGSCRSAWCCSRRRALPRHAAGSGCRPGSPWWRSTCA